MIIFPVGQKTVCCTTTWALHFVWMCNKTFVSVFTLDIEAQIREIQGKKPALDEAQGVGLDSTGYYDQEIYGGSDSRFAGYVTSIAATELEDVSDFILFV